MALPASRNRTYSATDPVLSADLNDLQDMVIGGRHGALVLCHPAIDAFATTGSPTIGNYYWQAAAAGNVMVLGLSLPVGGVITQIDAKINQNGATPVTWAFKSVDFQGLSSTIASNSGDASTGDKTLSTTFSATILSTRAYMLELTFGQANDRWYFNQTTHRN